LLDSFPSGRHTGRLMNQPIPPPLPNEKKGMSCLAVGGIGCLVLLAAVFLGGGALVAKFLPQIKTFMSDMEKDPVKAAAMLALNVNPDIEVQSTDDEKREVTFKIKSSGESMTVSFEDLSQGKLKMTNGKGEEISIDASDAAQSGIVMKGPDGQAVIGGGKAVGPPAWVPVYPGATAQEGGMRMDRPDGTASGIAVLSTADAVQAVQDFYTTKLKEEGYEIGSTTVVDQAVVLSAEKAGAAGEGKSTLSVTVAGEGSGQTKIAITYQQGQKE
jgi:hypothetical protein